MKTSHLKVHWNVLKIGFVPQTSSIICIQFLLLITVIDCVYVSFFCLSILTRITSNLNMKEACKMTHIRLKKCICFTYNVNIGNCFYWGKMYMYHLQLLTCIYQCLDKKGWCECELMSMTSNAKTLHHFSFVHFTSF